MPLQLKKLYTLVGPKGELVTQANDYRGRPILINVYLSLAAARREARNLRAAGHWDARVVTLEALIRKDESCRS